MTFGADGRKEKIKVTWKQFQKWQRWDEYPERKSNPPMTVDMTFWYEGEKYYLDSVEHAYGILTEKWETVAMDSNFLFLLNKPIERWNGKSFRNLIDRITFEN